MFFNTKKDTYQLALYYIELYANPVRMAMIDLESGKIKNPDVLSLISQIMVDEASHKLDDEVSF
jgi:hypothetical protein